MVHTISRAPRTIPRGSDETISLFLFAAVVVVFIDIHFTSSWFMRLSALLFEGFRELPVLRLLRLGVVDGRERRRVVSCFGRMVSVVDARRLVKTTWFGAVGATPSWRGDSVGTNWRRWPAVVMIIEARAFFFCGLRTHGILLPSSLRHGRRSSTLALTCGGFGSSKS